MQNRGATDGNKIIGQIIIYYQINTNTKNAF